jgi:hypothetical protein
MRILGAALCLGSVLLCACHKAPSDTDKAPQAPASDAKSAAGGKPETEGKEAASEGVVVLTPEQVEKLGLVTQAAQSVEYREETAGYGLVVPHDGIAQAAADLATAQAAERQSRSALERAKQLSGTPGAVSAEVDEAAVRQAAVDAAALTLTMARLSSTVGRNPPWQKGENDAILRDLASGRIKLLRATFPLGALSGGTPASLRAAHIGATAPDAGSRTRVVWNAPADAGVPGRSFFALLKDSDAAEGERLRVWAPTEAVVSGVVVPIAAVVMSADKYWCYVEKKPGTYLRTQIETSRPIAEGYVATEGIAAGDKIVTTAAAQLLAAESKTDSEPD